MGLLLAVSTTLTFITPVCGAAIWTLKSMLSPAEKDCTLAVLSEYWKPFKRSAEEHPQ